VENDNAIGQDVKTESTNEEGVNDTSVDNDNIKTENNIPYARFKEQNDKLKTAQAELDSLKSGQEKARTQKMEDDGKLKELLAEQKVVIDSLQTKADKLDKIQADTRERLISTLPDDLKEDEDVLAMTNNQLSKMMDKLDSHKSATVDNSAPSRGLANVTTDLKSLDRDTQRKNWSDILKKHTN
jgi:hypothetical protein